MCAVLCCVLIRNGLFSYNLFLISVCISGTDVNARSPAFPELPDLPTLPLNGMSFEGVDLFVLFLIFIDSAWIDLIRMI